MRTLRREVDRHELRRTVNAKRWMVGADTGRDVEVRALDVEVAEVEAASVVGRDDDRAEHGNAHLAAVRVSREDGRGTEVVQPVHVVRSVAENEQGQAAGSIA